RTVRILFCNEEHTPWTSRFAADAAAQRGDRILAVLNQDSLDGKSDEDMAAGRQCHVVAYSTDEGRPLAELMVRMNDLHDIGLDASVAHKERVNDDDGMFIKAGFRTTVMNIGSWPFADSEYHLVGDTPDRVDMHNLARSARLVLATVLELDRTGTIALS
ncbi:MAG: M28 family peptidase, partial [Lentisphaeria bacterium]|nr:M28 family peptidase [Lentisphaeria bacterium]